MEGTIRLNRPDAAAPARAATINDLKPLPPVKKAPAKNNMIGITVWVDGAQHDYLFSVPLSSTLLSGQKTNARLGELIEKMLAEKFGKIARL